MTAGSPAHLVTSASAAVSCYSRRKPWCWRPAASGAPTKITSNSWEYTGDGHALAYHAGADLMDMEFVQFHPTGMIWPPSVCGILVTEGVRGEGGVLRNKEGRRFMFDDIPELYRTQTADNEEEGWRYTQGDKNARRPPELLTRDHIARCIVREIKEGRGSPHGGVFLGYLVDQGTPSQRRRAHSRGSFPACTTSSKQLADIDITKEPMEVGPTTHYMMGGVKVDGDTQMSTVPGLFAAGECAAGLHGANRLGGNSLSDLLVFGKRAGRYAACFAKEHGAGRIDEAQVGRQPPGRSRPSSASTEPRTLSDPAKAAGDDAGPGRHRAHGKRNEACARRDRRAVQANQPPYRFQAIANTTTAGTPPWTFPIC